MILAFNINLIDEAVSKVASSENPAYPAANIYDIERRRKTWRSYGYWLVELGLNTIVFRETTGGADLTATIPDDEYTSDATFFAAIKAALEAAGDSVYTVNRDVTTGKIKITSDMSGGGNDFELRWLTAPDFGDILGFDTSANDTGAANYTADLLRIHTEEFFIFDFGFPCQPTGVIAVNDRNIPINISPGATVVLHGNPTNNFATPAESFTITVRDFLLGYLNPDGISQLQVNGYRYWKVQIIDNDNTDLYLELGAIFLGTHANMVRGCPAFPYEGRPIDNSQIDFSESGQTWVGKRPKSEIHQLGWEKLTNDDFALLKEMWETYGKTSSFFVCMDPNNAFSSDGVFWTRLVKFNDEPTHRLVSPGNWSYSWTLREEL